MDEKEVVEKTRLFLDMLDLKVEELRKTQFGFDETWYRCVCTLSFLKWLKRRLSEDEAKGGS